MTNKIAKRGTILRVNVTKYMILSSEFTPFHYTPMSNLYLYYLTYISATVVKITFCLCLSVNAVVSECQTEQANGLMKRAVDKLTVSRTSN